MHEDEYDDEEDDSYGDDSYDNDKSYDQMISMWMIMKNFIDIKCITLVSDMGPFTGQGLRYTVRTNVSKAIVIEVPNIDSYPPPIITWYHNSQPMNTEGSKYQVTLNGSLVLLDRGIGDNANYYKVEALNGNTNTLEQGPNYDVIIQGNCFECSFGFL
jgi:hypothetical protein